MSVFLSLIFIEFLVVPYVVTPPYTISISISIA